LTNFNGFTAKDLLLSAIYNTIRRFYSFYVFYKLGDIAEGNFENKIDLYLP